MSDVNATTEDPSVEPVRSYTAHLEQIGAVLANEGALGAVLVDAAPLAVIERRYGPRAHQKALASLREILDGIHRHEPDFRPFVVCATNDPDEVALLFDRARSDDRFYRERLPEVAQAIVEALAQHGHQLVYPYEREAPTLAVGHSIVFFNPGLGAERQSLEVFERARADAALNRAIVRREQHRQFEELVLSEDVAILYEPIVNMTSREVLGYEALVRGPWKSELHAPNKLFQLAEETGLVFELDCLCRRTALRGARGLEPGRKLFLNCLPTSIHDPAFRGETLRATLAELDLRPEDLVFEISERESIDNFSIFREARDQFKEIGFQIALDDTGVAYGSLEAVMELAPDFIKVDMSLVRGIDTDPPRQELLRALHAVAGKLGAQIIAEGIESTEELETLQRLGIPYGQGYLFGRAAPLRRTR